jgi:hypothetical protein
MSDPLRNKWMKNLSRELLFVPSSMWSPCMGLVVKG